MTLTYKQLKGQVQLACGGDPSTANGVTANERIVEIINHAGEHLFSRAWRFRERTSATLATVASQSYVSLPTDVGEIISVEPVNSWSSSITFVDPASFINMSSTGIEPDLTYIMTLTWWTDSGDLVPRLDVYPTPAATNASAFYIRYKAKWIEITTTNLEAASEATALPNIASFVESLLCEYIRAFAEGGEDGTTHQRLAAVDSGILLDRALRVDGTMQPDYGQLPMAGLGGTGQSYASGTVSAPVATAILWRGTWSASNTYAVNDIVHYAVNGNSYICTQQTTASGEVPTNASYWDIFTAS